MSQEHKNVTSMWQVVKFTLFSISAGLIQIAAFTLMETVFHLPYWPSYLTALFHKNLQISPGEYIRRIKLQESKQMIRENDLNFTEIAAQLHYSTVHHFSRQFKEKFGITPTEYAKSVR